VTQTAVAQLRAIASQEFFRYVFRLRGAWVYLLAFGPAAIIAVHASALWVGRSRATMETDTQIMAGFFLIYYLRLGIYFGCLGIFTRLFRGDMAERVMHYYFLAPVRREILVAGKFLAGLAMAFLAFGAGVAFSFALMYVGHGQEGWRFLSAGPGLSHLASYLLVTLLACTGYGSLFLLLGILFRNPIIPAVIVMLWEGLNHFLPNALKKLSVIYYLEPLCPVELPLNDLGSVFAIPPDPISPWLAVPGLLLVAAGMLFYACFKSRTLEINYSSD
jgi:hypothetical protein